VLTSKEPDATPTAARARAGPRRGRGDRGGWPVGLAWALWALALLSLAAVAWLDHLLRRAGRPELAVLTLEGATNAALPHVGVATVGAVVASRRPRHPVGWLLLAIGLLPSASMPVFAYASYGLAARPGALPAARWAALYLPAFAFTALALLGFVLLLTPDGSLPSRRWRWWARGTPAALVGLLLAVALAPNPLTAPYQVPTTPFDLHGVRGAALVADQAGFAAAAVAVLVGAASLLVRFRRARGVERQQLRWVALAAVAAVLLVGAVGADEATGGAVVRDPGLAGVLSLAVLEVGIGASVLRYRLYDLDRIISRTVAWGVLTVLLGGGYAGVILGLGALLGHDSSLAVAAATLALAAAFQPARRLVQSAVDRRFNRSRYDAARTIQAFAARLRQQVDLDSLTDELLAVVDQTMQPTRSSLWLRPAPLPGTTGAAGAAAPARTSGTRR
jgi:hypothetical protein